MHTLAADYTYINGYIVLGGLNLGPVPTTLTVKGYNLSVKSEFHITLICVYLIAELIDQPKQLEIEEKIVNDFAEFTAVHPLNKYKILPEFRFVERDNQKTVIILAEVEGLDKFFKVLNQKYRVSLPVQPAHISLYTLQLGQGIGILSDEELQKESEAISLPELVHLATKD